MVPTTIPTAFRLSSTRLIRVSRSSDEPGANKSRNASRARIRQSYHFPFSLPSKHTDFMPKTDAADHAAVHLDTEFTRGLGLFDSTMMVAGSMIGSGIFIVSAEMSRQVGSPGWLLAAWLVTGFLTIMGALSYGEL